MKLAVNYEMFVDSFEAFDRSGQFSRNGLRALFDYLSDIERDLEEEMVLDVIGICCDYVEYDGIVEAANNYHDFGEYTQNDFDDDQLKKAAYDFLTDNTRVVVFEGGVIIQNF